MLRNGKHIEKIYTGANFNHITKYIDNINSRFNVNFYHLSNTTNSRENQCHEMLNISSLLKKMISEGAIFNNEVKYLYLSQ